MDLQLHLDRAHEQRFVSAPRIFRIAWRVTPRAADRIDVRSGSATSTARRATATSALRPLSAGRRSADAGLDGARHYRGRPNRRRRGARRDRRANTRARHSPSDPVTQARRSGGLDASWCGSFANPCAIWRSMERFLRCQRLNTGETWTRELRTWSEVHLDRDLDRRASSAHVARSPMHRKWPWVSAQRKREELEPRDVRTVRATSLRSAACCDRAIFRPGA
jgi:hypothetical protein